MADSGGKLKVFTQQGIHLVQGGLSAPLAELTSLLTGFDVLISCVTHERYGTDQVKLVQAAKAAGVKRYLPTAFGTDVEAVGSPSAMSPIFEMRTNNYAAIAAVGLPYSVVNCGQWTEHLLTRLLGIDYRAKVVTAIGTFDSRVSTTSLSDLGELVCDLLLDASTVHQAKLNIASDLVTLEDIAQAVERATGSHFERRLATMEEMDARRKAAVFPNFDAPAVFLTLIHNGKGVWWPKEQTWNETHPTTHPVTKLNDCAERVIRAGEHLQPASS